MGKRMMTLGAIVVAVTLLGAACTKKAVVTSENTNVTVNVPINTSVQPTNSRTTGDFTTSTNTAVQGQTVTITTAGVSPKTLTVSVGTTVTFENSDVVSHQIASDPHPSHTGLPGFDNTASNQSFSFTFTKPGSFGYHDHLDPFNSSLKGTIVVQ